MNTPSPSSTAQTPQAVSTPQPKERGVMAYLGSAAKQTGQFAIGAAKGAASTVLNASELGQKMFNPGNWVGSKRSQDSLEWTQRLQEEVKPEGTAQNLGFAAEQIGEFFIPGEAGVKGTKALSAVKAAQQGKKVIGAAKYAPRLAQMFTEAAPQLLISSAHEGEITPENVVSSAAGGAMSAAGKLPQLALGGTQTVKGAYEISQGDIVSGIQNLGFGVLSLYGGSKTKGYLLDQSLSQALTKTQQLSGETTARELPAYTGNWLQRLGKKIQTTVMKPSSADIDAGFDVNNVAKYDVGGTLPQSYSKVSQRIAGYGDRLNKIKEEYGDPMVIDMRDTLIATQRELLGRGKNLRQGELNNALDTLEKELTTFVPEWKQRKVSFIDGWKAKAAAGEEAALHHDPMKAKNANAKEQVYNTFYSKMREQLEQNAPEAYQEANKALSELIPIRNAIIRRMPINERNNVVGLLDLISAGSTALNPKAAPLFLASRLARSGKFADILMKMGAQEQPNLIENIPSRPNYPALPAPRAVNEATGLEAPITPQVIPLNYPKTESGIVPNYSPRPGVKVQRPGQKLLPAGREVEAINLPERNPREPRKNLGTPIKETKSIFRREVKDNKY